jgi:hypothetical protein
MCPHYTRFNDQEKEGPFIHIMKVYNSYLLRVWQTGATDGWRAMLQRSPGQSERPNFPDLGGVTLAVVKTAAGLPQSTCNAGGDGLGSTAHFHTQYHTPARAMPWEGRFVLAHDITRPRHRPNENLSAVGFVGWA